jgi:circadian clock protein KaiC
MPDRPPAPTGIGGLDDILRGGFPRGRVLLVQGDPGVGKTTLALQYLIDGVRRGERCLYVTLSETREELHQVATSHGLSLEGVEIFELTPPDAFRGEDENTLFHPSEVELAETTKAVLDVCNRLRPQRIVFDSLSEIRLLAQSQLRYRREIFALKQYFSTRDCTMMLIDDQSDGHLESVAHGVIRLEQVAPVYGTQRRRLRVIKLRGVDFRGGYHDFAIRRGGLVVFPRLVAAEHQQPFSRERMATGLPELDALLAGGLDRGTSTLFLGPAGTGKSALTTQIAVACAARGERVVHYAFDESLATLQIRSDSLGLPVARYRQEGMITIRQVDPAEVPAGQFAGEVRLQVEASDARLVIIDSLNGFLNAMPEEEYLILQLHELLSYLGQRGIVTLMTMAQHGLVGTEVNSPVDVSYLADSVILLRHFEADGRMRKAISVLKRRTGAHESSIRELQLSDQGVKIGRPLVEFRGVLTGVPLYQGEAAALLGGRDGR